MPMDPHPFPFAHTRTASATFPLTHKPPAPTPNDVSGPFADTPRHVHKYTTSLGSSAGPRPGPSPGPRPGSGLRSRSRGLQDLPSFTSISTSSTLNHGSAEPRHRPRIDPFGFHHHHLDASAKHKHKHTKSRDLKLPRPMSHLASSGRGLLPTWTRDKDTRDDDGLLRPMTRETTSTTAGRSRWGSESTRGTSRRGSLLDVPEQHERLGPIRRQEIQSLDDLEGVKRRRKQGEEYLRSALTSTGTQATDATRRLDYTYYNLLERITALNLTISSFQDLSDSASSFLNDFDRETSTLDTEIRKQIIELKGFTPQSTKSQALESRMKSGQEKVLELGGRLEKVKSEIECWERRELDWQERMSRRLRIFWAVVGSAFMVAVLAFVVQNWPSLKLELDVHAPSLDIPPAMAEAEAEASSDPIWNQSLHASGTSQSVESVLAGQDETASASAWYPASLADRRESLQAGIRMRATDAGGSSTRAVEGTATDAEYDPLRVLDEL